MKNQLLIMALGALLAGPVAAAQYAPFHSDRVEGRTRICFYKQGEQYFKYQMAAFEYAREAAPSRVNPNSGTDQTGLIVADFFSSTRKERTYCPANIRTR